MSIAPQEGTRPAVPALPMLSVGGLALRLAVARGECFALLGPRGAGKSALLETVAGFRPAAGRDLLLDGRPIGRTPPQRRGIGYLGPGAALLPQLSVAQNLALPLRRGGLARAARPATVGAMLERLGLVEQATRRPAQLVPEAAARAALARALIARPRLLLLDDPFAALDRPARLALGFELRRLHADLGLTVLHATSDAAEALLLADRIGVIAGGRLRQIGPPQALFDEPATPLVASLLGEINLLPGVLVDEDEDEGLATVHLDCGIAVEARPAGAARGQRCVVAVRPERIAFATVSAEEMGDGALPATVQDVVPQGDHVRLRLIVGAPGAPPALLVVNRPAGAPLGAVAPGAGAAVAWQPLYAHALPPDSDRGG